MMRKVLEEVEGFVWVGELDFGLVEGWIEGREGGKETNLEQTRKCTHQTSSDINSRPHQVNNVLASI